MELFERDPWLGTLSGKLHLRYGDKVVQERTGDENSVGPVKFLNLIVGYVCTILLMAANFKKMEQKVLIFSDDGKVLSFQ